MDHLHYKDLLAKIVVGFGKQTDDLELDFLVLRFVLDSLQHAKGRFGPGFSPADDFLRPVHRFLVDISGFRPSLDDFVRTHNGRFTHVDILANTVSHRNLPPHGNGHLARCRRRVGETAIGSGLTIRFAFEVICQRAGDADHRLVQELFEVAIGPRWTAVVPFFCPTKISFGALVHRCFLPRQNFPTIPCCASRRSFVVAV
mmetsp:Transcript_25631/g.56387  ORF Transcript_25631/g.56387 Transcript_25631/m.56387 type:complete len:201 (+) Transcript_25631:937-1539(+)